MTKNINDLILSSDSDDFYHPNIDKKSFAEFRSQQKQKKKLIKRKRLEELPNLIEKASDSEKDALIKEKEKLEFELSEKIKETESNISINNTQNKNKKGLSITDADCDKFYKLLLFLLENTSIKSFISFVDNNPTLNMEVFQEYVLLNLSENIKVGNDDAGFRLCKLSLYLRYAISKGRSYMKKFSDLLGEEGDKHFMFEDECRDHYEESKKLILSMKKNPE